MASIENRNLVNWTLSGTYDGERPVPLARLILMFGKVLYPIVVLSILASQCTWTGTNPTYGPAELLQHLKLSGSRYIVTSPELLHVVESAVGKLDIAVDVILLTDILNNPPLDQWKECQVELATLHSLMKSETQATLLNGAHQDSDNEVAALMPTSGTTGRPKMVERTHRALILESKALGDDNAAKPYEVRRLYCLPIHHAFAFPEMAINALRLGQTSYFSKGFSYTFARNAFDFGITEILAVPSMLLALSKQAIACDKERIYLQSLRMVLSAGAPLPAHLAEKILCLFDSRPRLLNGWGMSECGRISTFKYPEADSTGSAGRPIGDCEVRLAEDTRTGLSNGHEAGELLVRGSHFMLRYRNAVEATAETIDSAGWLKTGDIGYLDDGKVYLVDRAKDIIKVDGLSVSPSELEEALADSEGIMDVAVVSSGYATGTEEHPVVFVVAKDADILPASLKKHLLSRLSRQKVAKCEIKIVGSIPRGPNGKILRHILRGQIASS
ncbi:Acyl-CoA ligase M9 [Pseudocercospora fuligena]|uniref:Acyl-CoA ligase M9 n=1 Tax=Pseudocercospora fuligena TaxID=685502 RepID=A0A8H6VD90_9PEZI|nr:Acyl-CoA ligase M9 [Pseudocercospora fuligena]